MTFKKHPKHLLAVAILSASGMAGIAPIASAQQTDVEEVVVTGLRGRPRTVTDAPVAIDTFDTDTIEAVSFVETGDIIQSLVPSFQNPRSPISDGATFIRQFNLRGLPPQYTLTLVNGKRRHRSALLDPGSGDQGPDVATIPSVAIGSIEVLRDGASSQYGSDAIAGVINFNLKEATDGFTFTYDTGEQFEGDGFQQTVQMNGGFAIGEDGFMNLSMEYSDVEFVERNTQYCGGTNPCIDPTRPEFDPNSTIGARVLTPEFQANLQRVEVEGGTVQPWGQPNNEAFRVFVNTGYDLGGGTELYGFANFSESLGDGPFNYRHPGVGNVNGFRRLADGSLWGLTANQGQGPDYVSGYTPRFEGRVTDYSAVGGVRGQTEGGLNWDLSARFGSSEIEYRLFNTWNPSLGPFSPTDMDVGDQINQENQFQADFSKDFDVDGLASPVTLAFGASFFEESFEIVEAQDSASFTPGPWAQSDPFGLCAAGGTASLAGQQAINNGSTLDCSNSSDPVFRSYGVGSDGFPGFGPAAASVNERDSVAMYVDISADVTDKLLLQAALRYEDYSDFGDATVGKVAARYYITDEFAIRGSAGTGFRAPTPGQQFTTNIRTILPFGAPVNVGLFPPTSAAAAALGALPLDAEDTVNLTAGFTADIAGVTLTVDWYQIEIEGRVNSVTNRPVSNNPANAAGFANFQLLVANGVPNPESLGELNWYANTFDTTNTGIDIVATYDYDWGNGHATDFSFAYNYNEQELDGNVSAFFSPYSQFNFEDGILESNAIATAVHRYSDFTFVARGRWFGEYGLAQRPAAGVSIDGSVFDSQTFGSTLYVDLEGAYQFNDKLRFTVGARNAFDEYPDRVTLNQAATRGRIYHSGSPQPWEGGYYYGRVDFSL
jgi:iron complex outermembrane recepter protein